MFFHLRRGQPAPLAESGDELLTVRVEQAALLRFQNSFLRNKGIFQQVESEGKQIPAKRLD